jgi:plastocyanin
MTSRTNPRRLVAGAAALSLVLVAASCDDGDGDGDGDDAVLDPVETTRPIGVDTTAPVPDTTAEAGGSTTDEPSVEQAEVAMIGISFDPADITVPVGATVVWTNEDAVDHTTTADDDAWDSGVVATGESFDFTFDEPGTYTYLCEIHPAVMQGTITVEG